MLYVDAIQTTPHPYPTPTPPQGGSGLQGTSCDTAARIPPASRPVPMRQRSVLRGRWVMEIQGLNRSCRLDSAPSGLGVTVAAAPAATEDTSHVASQPPHREKLTPSLGPPLLKLSSGSAGGNLMYAGQLQIFWILK